MPNAWLITLTELTTEEMRRGQVQDVVHDVERGLRYLGRPILTQLMEWLDKTDHAGPAVRWQLRPLGYLLPKGARAVAVLSGDGQVLASADPDGHFPALPADVLTSLQNAAAQGRPESVTVASGPDSQLTLHYPAKHVVRGEPKGDRYLVELADRVTLERPDGTTVTFKDRYARA